MYKTRQSLRADLPSIEACGENECNIEICTGPKTIFTRCRCKPLIKSSLFSAMQSSCHALELLKLMRLKLLAPQFTEPFYRHTGLEIIPILGIVLSCKSGLTSKRNLDKSTCFLYKQAATKENFRGRFSGKTAPLVLGSRVKGVFMPTAMFLPCQQLLLLSPPQALEGVEYAGL